MTGPRSSIKRARYTPEVSKRPKIVVDLYTTSRPFRECLVSENALLLFTGNESIGFANETQTAVAIKFASGDTTSHDTVEVVVAAALIGEAGPIRENRPAVTP